MGQSKVIKKYTSFIIIYWLPVFLWMGLIFYLSSRPVLGTGLLYWPDFVLKKTAHFVEYFALSYLWFRALVACGLAKKRAYLITAIVCVAYAFSDEFHQSFVLGRESRIRDVVIDSIGSLAYLFLYNQKNKRSSNK